MPGPEKALEASEVRKTYAKEGRTLEVVDIAQFAAQEGEFITVIGPSGCGKSTFLHIMGGFIPADHGSIRVYGRTVNGPGPDRGMMFQEFALFPWKSVAGNVAWVLASLAVPVVLSPTALGLAFVLVQVAAVLALLLLEQRALRVA